MCSLSSLRLADDERCVRKKTPKSFNLSRWSRRSKQTSALLARDRQVFEFARAHVLPVAWVLAGGYTRDITKVVEVHLNTFRAALSVFGERGT